MGTVDFEIKYDLRNPGAWFRPWSEHYRVCLEQVEWAEAHGFTRVHLHEHHFAEDGYLPSPFLIASAIAARTSRIKISLSIIILPLAHPVRLAEDIAVLSHLSGGRLEVILGAGARREEFEGYGVRLSDRAAIMDEGVELLAALLSGETVTASGGFWEISGARVTPELPAPPAILLGGATRPAARRAARLADGFVAATPAALEMWREEMRALGRDPDLGDGRSMTPPVGPRNFLHVAHDPEAAWAVIAPHALHESAMYAKWAGGGRRSIYTSADDGQALRESGTYGVLTPDETINLVGQLHEHGHDRIIMHPMMGGMDPAVGMESLRLVTDEVMARLGG